MRILNTIHRRALAWKRPKTHGKIEQYLRDFELAENATLPQNLEKQWRATREMLRHAYETVPFYRQRFDEAGMHPSRFGSPDDLRRIPPLQRDDLVASGPKMWSTKYAPADLFHAATGGTSNSPVPLVRDADCLQRRTAIQMRFDGWSGLIAGDKVLWLWGATMDFAANPSWRWRLWERVVLRRTWAPASQMNESVCAEYHRLLDRFRPDAIMAYPTALALFSDYLKQQSAGFHHPRSIVVTAEPLTERQRHSIESAFGMRCFVQYGARDFGMLAAECEQHRNLHFNPLSAFIEFVPLNAEVSEVLVTDLTNAAMPLIRYRVGDCATPVTGSCACGRGYPLMSNVEGRVSDNFVLRDGTFVPGVVLPARILRDHHTIDKLQIVQEEVSDFVLRYVPGPEFTPDALEAVETKLRTFIGAEPSVRFERVADIPREASGKTRLCISRAGQRAARPKAMDA